jgi:hypothetical protein
MAADACELYAGFAQCGATAAGMKSHLPMPPGYREVSVEVLASFAGGVDTLPSSNCRWTQMDDNKSNNEPRRITRNIFWQTRPIPAPCEHKYEIIAREQSGDLRRCSKCGGLEAE